VWERESHQEHVATLEGGEPTLVEPAPQPLQRVGLEEAGDESIVSRMAQIEEALAAREERLAAAAEGQASRMRDEDVGREPMRPAAGPGPHAEVRLFPVALAEDCGIEVADLLQTVAAQIQTEPHPDGEVRPDTRMGRGGKRLERGTAGGIQRRVFPPRIARDRACIAPRRDCADGALAIGRLAQTREPIRVDAGVGVEHDGIEARMQREAPVHRCRETRVRGVSQQRDPALGGPPIERGDEDGIVGGIVDDDHRRVGIDRGEDALDAIDRRLPAAMHRHDHGGAGRARDRGARAQPLRAHGHRPHRRVEQERGVGQRLPATVGQLRRDVDAAAAEPGGAKIDFERRPRAGSDRAASPSVHARLVVPEPQLQGPRRAPAEARPAAHEPPAAEEAPIECERRRESGTAAQEREAAARDRDACTHLRLRQPEAELAGALAGPDELRKRRALLHPYVEHARRFGRAQCADELEARSASDPSRRRHGGMPHDLAGGVVQ
jgi:hypothetical protein